jgi:hypothetical protein
MGYRLQSWFNALTRRQKKHDKFFVNNNGKMIEHEELVRECLSTECLACEKRTEVHFPVNLAVQYGEDIPQIYRDFVLNISNGDVCITTDRPMQEGSIIIMHFYIPPHEKLLGEFKGEVVVGSQTDSCPKCMYVKFFDVSAENMQRLEDFLEGKRSLLDIST